MLKWAAVLGAGGVGGIPEEGVGALGRFHSDVSFGLQWNYLRLLTKQFLPENCLLHHPIFFSTSLLTGRHFKTFLAALIFVLLFPVVAATLQNC